MEDYEIVSAYLGTWASDMPAGWSWSCIRKRERGLDLDPPRRRDFEVVGNVIGRHKLPDDVDAAWCRIVARERARMGLPDIDTERSAAVLFLAEVRTATAADLVAEGVYPNRNTAAVMLATLAKQGRIRRVSAGVYAWGGGA